MTSTALLSGPQSRTLRERVWTLADEVEIASRDAAEAAEASEENVAALVGLAGTLELALMEFGESLDRLRVGAGRLRVDAR